MDLLAEKYLHYRTIPIEALIGSGRTQRNMADLEPKDIVDYACEDADVTLRLYPILKEEMEKYEVTSVFTHIEMPLLPVLARMERNGVRLDTAALEETGAQFHRKDATVRNRHLRACRTRIYHHFTQTSGSSAV